MFKIEDFQSFGKIGYEAYVASATAFTKGLQAMAQEATEYSRKSFAKNSEAFEKVSAVRSFDKLVEVQQQLAKDAYEDFVAEAAKMNELYVSTAREAYKPFEANMAAFGVKAPQQQ